MDIIWAFALFFRKHVDYKLLIAGFGNESYIAQCVDLAKKLGCEKNVLFSGYVEDVRPLMDNATALVVASYNEGFGRMSAEACFRGCLLIGRNTGGTKEIMDSVGGFPFSYYRRFVKANVCCGSFGEIRVSKDCFICPKEGSTIIF